MTVRGTWGTPAAPWRRRELPAWSVLVHGGAGALLPEQRASHREGCRLAVEVGAAVLRAGGSALAAAARAVAVLEDDPRFNAGTGAALDEDGRVALDAAIMEGKELRAGAVACMPPFRNPIAVARAALEDGAHILYVAEGAARFARGAGFVPLSHEQMTSVAAKARWEAVRAGRADGGFAGGTVGCVARDARGLVVAATSTGGTSNKRAGRVGDAPILGAGTYADDAAGAASNTGHGEGVMRTLLGHFAVARMGEGARPEVAARVAIEHLERRVGSHGGIILVDRVGRLGLARSTDTMSWAAVWAGADGAVDGV